MTPTQYKALRQRLGTQAEVAASLGINRVTLARRETDALPITKEAELAIKALKPKKKRKP